MTIYFIKNYNSDGSYNSLLNVNYIVRIYPIEIKVNKQVYIKIDYLSNDCFEGYIKKEDYLKLIGEEIKKNENKKEGTKK